MAGWFKIDLWKRVMVGLVLGLALGLSLRYGMGAEAGGALVTKWVYPVGQGFVALIKMLIVPLIFTTLAAGIIAMGDPKRLGSLGLRTIGLYLGTTAIAVTLGLFIGSIIPMGAGLGADTFAAASADAVDSVGGKIANADSITLLGRFFGADPVGATQAFLATPVMNFILLAFLLVAAFYHERGSLFQKLVFPVLLLFGIAFSGLNVITVIISAILLGVAILLIGGSDNPVARSVEKAADVSMKVTLWVMEVAPFGVFALMAWVMATKGLGVLVNLGLLAFALYLTCVLQILISYGGIIKGLLRLPLMPFYRGVLDAQAVAFSTASSSATLPVTITCANENLGINKTVASSVLPLGATINMDGTAIYLGLVAIFAAQAMGIDMTLGMYVMVALTATLTSIGAAGIPSAGLLLAAVVLAQIGIGAEQAVLIIAFIFPFDRLLDMMRTLTNVTGDTAVATAVAKWEGELDEEVFRAADRY